MEDYQENHLPGLQLIYIDPLIQYGRAAKEKTRQLDTSQTVNVIGQLNYFCS